MWSSLLLPTNRKVPRVLFFGDSAPHQLQTNGLNLIRLFNPMALKFDTSSNYKKTISPLKCFKPYIVSPLEQNNSIQNLLSLSLSLSRIEAFSLHGIATGPDLRFRLYWPFSHWKIAKIPTGTVTKFRNFSLFHQTLLYVGHQRRFSMTMATTGSLQGSHDHHRRCLLA